MLEKIRVFEFGTVVITGIIVFFLVFLGWIIAGQILRPMLFPTAKEALDPAYEATYRRVPTLIGLAIIYGPFLAGLWWSWNKPVIFMVERDGEWILRNSFYIALLRIPPDQPRQLEGCFQREFREDSLRDYYYVGDLNILTPSQPGITIRVTCDAQPDGNPDFFEKFGYGGATPYLAGPHEGTMTPMHTWNASGPVFAAEKSPVPLGSTRDVPEGENE